MKNLIFAFTVIGLLFLSLSTLGQDRSQSTTDAITGANPTAGYTTGIGQVVEPIIKSPIGSPQSAEPLEGKKPKGLTTPYDTGATYQTPSENKLYQDNYKDSFRQSGKYYDEGVKVNGKYQAPDVSRQGETVQETTESPDTATSPDQSQTGLPVQP